MDPRLKALDALPITATKVAAFLMHETTRAKKKCRNGEAVTGTSVGKSHVSQAISALEYHRFHYQDDDKSDPEAAIPLRSDKRIQAFESSSKHNEPKRTEKAQVLKATGTSSDTYTPDELAQCASWCLTHFSGPRQVFIGLRDRAQLLVASVTAFRGDSSRALLWSDLFISDVPIPELGEDVTVSAFAALANNAKHNQDGRVDEFGALRHRRVELCAIGSLAMLFFAHFHILDTPVPNFSPDFSMPGFGEWGHREWYSFHVFSTKSLNDMMSYDTHRGRVNKMHDANNISISKVTHATRPYAAQTCRSNGASVTSTKALGGWSESGSYRNCYDRALPLDALLGAAMFNGRKPESYRVLRDCLEPPPELLMSIFPWIEREDQARLERQNANYFAKDIALKQLFLLLKWFRRVLLQDSALLFVHNPHAAMFKYPPFNTTSFRTFASESTDAIAAAEKAARIALHDLPKQMVQTLEGVLTGHALDMQRVQIAHSTELQGMRDDVSQMRLLVEILAGSKRSRPKRPRSSAPRSPNPRVVLGPESYVVPPSRPHVSMSPTVFPPIMDPSSFADGFPLRPLVFPPVVLPSPLLSVWPQLPISPAPPAVLPSLICSPCLVPPPLIAPVPSLALPLAATHRTSLPTILTTPDQKWAQYVQRFGEERWRRHSPEWKDGDWLPHYRFQGATQITEYWTEWTSGLGGFLPVRDLDEVWDAKWRRNIGSLRTEHGRRLKIINLIGELSSKPQWGVRLALRFLVDQYEPKYKARAFADHLIHNRGQVIAASNSYPK